MADDNKALFSQKIQELTDGEIDLAADFFADEFGSDETAVKSMRSSQAESPQAFTKTFNDADIDEEWLSDTESYDGQLAVDVFQTEDEMVITSAVAGVRSEDIDISMNGDMITIRGMRKPRFSEIEDDEFFIRECYWGGFSRSIILPLDVNTDEINATLEHGILTITMPKSKRSRNSKIEVVDISDEE